MRRAKENATKGRRGGNIFFTVSTVAPMRINGESG